MIRELTFQGGNTLTKDAQCPECSHDFQIPFRVTPNQNTPLTFEIHEANQLIEDFFDTDECCYHLIVDNVRWSIGLPTIGIQECFYDEIKRNVQSDKKPDVAFMKIMPFLLHDQNEITPEGIKAKQKEFKAMDNIDLFDALNQIINNMTVGIKGLKMKCPECGTEVHTELTFPGGASSLFSKPNILDRFRKKG
jgi:hypothetical protein